MAKTKQTEQPETVVTSQIKQTEVVNPVEETVILRSADGRELEASINNQFWRGKTIEVPVSAAGDVRRMLEVGGYYLKN